MADFTLTPDFVIGEEVGYNTRVSNFENGIEQRRAVRSRSRRKFSLDFRNRSKTQMQQVRDFFIAKMGMLTSFTWVNPNDSVTYTVRYVEDTFKFDFITAGLYNFSCEFIEVL